MVKDQIVIVTEMDDSHADDVIILLQQMGHEAIRLNTEEIPLGVTVSLSFGNYSDEWRGSIANHSNGRVIDVDAVRSVWWRRPFQYGLPDDLSEQEREFASDEIDAALRGLWSSLDCYWISYPERIREASYKGGQLKRAAHLGFEVPCTLITMDSEKARAFYEACDRRVIFKVMSDPFLGTQRTAYMNPDQPPELYRTVTTLITDSELAELETVRLVPCMFQEYIPKRVELRVTVIGDEVFAAEIDSQADERTLIDWRHSDVDVPYREATLPDEVSERCLAFVKSYGLNFSAMDLILTPDGRYVFLENNPNGQFIFVEHFVPELRMTEALATCLVRGANG